MGNQENKGTSIGISRLEKILIAVALLLLVGIVIFDAVTASTAYPSKVTYVVSEGAVSEAAVSANTSANASQTASDPSAVEDASLCININTATVEELQQLPGIGAVKAAAIIEYREINGDFVSIEEIMEVNGIGEKTFEKIRAYIVLS